jgi:hypothetical protein
MKSLNDWLASSDEEDNSSQRGSRRGSQTRSDASPGASIPQSMDSPTAIRRKQKAPFPKASPGQSSGAAGDTRRQQEAEERRRRQEEMREKMRGLVGEAVVDRIEAQVRRVNDSDDSNTSGFSSAHNLQMPASLPPVVPTSARSSQEVPQGALKRPSQTLDPAVFGSVVASGQFNPRASIDASLLQQQQHMEVVEIMLADRGTQTVSSVECQTDPDFGAGNCAGCYYDRYGHAPPTNRCPHGAPGFSGADEAQPDPIFAAMFARAGSIAGRPAGVPVQSSASAALWQAQLRAIQQTIDMCISKYNLPAVPQTTSR